jgi:hypothetical protein
VINKDSWAASYTDREAEKIRGLMLLNMALQMFHIDKQGWFLCQFVEVLQNVLWWKSDCAHVSRNDKIHITNGRNCSTLSIHMIGPHKSFHCLLPCYFIWVHSMLQL